MAKLDEVDEYHRAMAASELRGEEPGFIGYDAEAAKARRARFDAMSGNQRRKLRAKQKAMRKAWK